VNFPKSLVIVFVGLGLGELALEVEEGASGVSFVQSESKEVYMDPIMPSTLEVYSLQS